jgi:predicted deacetylase
MSAKFLVRFDDMCPTVNWPLWQRLEDVMVEEGVRPILAVVPDNRDSVLHEGKHHDRFWDVVRGWQARKWSIGLHGYQHLYVNRNAGLVGLNHYSEFAGVPIEEQRAKLISGLEIFKREGVRPDCWIAPAHSFDENTIKVLSELGVTTISDGLSLFPHRDSQNKNVVWVPQQLWRFRYVPFGVWTVCIHSCDRMYKEPDHFRERIRLFKNAITTLPEIVAAYSSRRESVADGLFGELWHFAIRAKWSMSGSPPPSHDVTGESRADPDGDSHERVKAAS